MHVTHTKKLTRNILRLRRRHRQRRRRVDRLLRALSHEAEVARTAVIISAALCWANAIYSMASIPYAWRYGDDIGSEEAKCARAHDQAAFSRQSAASLGGTDVSCA